MFLIYLLQENSSGQLFESIHKTLEFLLSYFIYRFRSIDNCSEELRIPEKITCICVAFEVDECTTD